MENKIECGIAKHYEKQNLNFLLSRNMPYFIYIVVATHLEHRTHKNCFIKFTISLKVYLKKSSRALHVTNPITNHLCLHYIKNISRYQLNDWKH